MLDLVTCTQAAQRLGISSRAVRRLMAKPGAPEPVTSMAGARVWHFADVIAWYGASEHRLAYIARKVEAP